MPSYPVKVWNGSQWVEVAAQPTDLTNYVKKSANTGTIDLTGTSFIPPVQTSGRNRIINGDFSVWQRGTSFSPGGGEAYTADRWVASGVNTVSRQLFNGEIFDNVTPQYYIRLERTSNPGNYPALFQRVEDVRTFAGQTVTVSFWARSLSAFNAGSWFVWYYQNFGTGGSSAVANFEVQSISPTSSFVKYSINITLPDTVGKTISSDSSITFGLRNNLNSATSGQLDVWGFQVERGSSSTPYEQKPYYQELRDCMRYYWRSTGASSWASYGVGRAQTSTTLNWTINLPVTMRVRPSSMEFSSIAAHQPGIASFAFTAMTVTEGTTTSVDGSGIVASGLTAGLYYHISNNGSTSGYVAFNAEL